MKYCRLHISTEKMSLISESKKLAIKLRANEESFVTGQLDLNETLDETERLWSEVQKKLALTSDKHNNNEKITANEFLPDSNLMKLQTGLAKRSAKLYNPDSLVFNPTEFSIKLKQYYDHSAASESNSESSSRADELLWHELGNVAKKFLYTVPSFSFMYGTFDPDPVEIVKKKRKIKDKDKVGDVTRPISTNLKDNSDNKDPMIKEAERVLGILAQLCRKNKVVCFYEFVTDPASFVRTVENIFILSLLVKEGCVRIVKDRNGLPCLSSVDDRERRDRNPSETKQCILSICLEEWKDIVKKFKLKTPLIPPRKSIL